MITPKSTYRLQLHAGFNFNAAKKIVAYLAELGISDVYASPIFCAREGSVHGYDVVNPTQINPELGSFEEFEAFNAEAKKYGMGWLQDIVPNHMAYDTRNEWLMDVLEHRENSEYFNFFDINWTQDSEEIKDRVLAPLLGSFYHQALQNGEIQLNYDETGLSINYFSLRVPVRIESYAKFISYNLGELTRKLGRKNPDFIKLLGILYILKNIIGETKGKERADQIFFVKSLLWELYQSNSDVQEFIKNNLVVFNGEAGNPESFNLLDRILDEQYYRLSFWKVGAEEINYRRFFTVNELISVKVEEEKVFNKTHELILKLVEEGKFTGLRIDHIDGLYNPSQYLQRLREKIGDTYLIVEKILESKESLIKDWNLEGTSGYDFLNYLNGIFCDQNNESELERIYSELIGDEANYHQLFLEKKGLILEKNLAGDLDNLGRMLKKISRQSREGSDFTLTGLKRALVEVLILFPVYRTYITPELGVNEIDRNYICNVIEEAKKRVPLLLNEFNYIQKILLLEYEELWGEQQRKDVLHFAMRIQQFTGPLMAKGIEDTLFYVYNRFVSLNEVGGNPGEFGVSLESFHHYNNQKQSEHLKHSMNATSTHDTKRAEDIRARLNVLSEIPELWEKQVYQWQQINQNKKEGNIPDANDEYFFYQNLVGAYPMVESDLAAFTQRMSDFITKSIREAKVHTAWLRPDQAYEDGCVSFVEKVLQDKQFLDSFIPFQKQIAEYAVYNSLSCVLLKSSLPGIPDFYQGTELWDLSLVDPDNRRPVDYETRLEYLQEIKQKAKQDKPSLMKELLTSWSDGKVKLFLTYQMLQARQKYSEVFLEGNYQPLTVSGKFAENVVAFAREYQQQTIVAIAMRFPTRLIQVGQLPLGTEVWQDTYIELPSSQWQNLITDKAIQGDKVAIGEIFQDFTVALLKNS